MAVEREGRLNRELTNRFNRAAPGALTAAGAVVVMRTQRIFVTFRPRGWATGATVRSLTVGPPERSRGRNSMRVKIGPTTKYAWFLHQGRRPGKPPPVYAILDWVREKHISGSYSVQTRKRLGSKATRESEDLATAFAIARAIGKRGTKPFPFLLVGLRQSRQEALIVFRRVLLANMAMANG